MLILTEKSSVAESFAAALNAVKQKGFFYNRSSDTAITYCVGHLYSQAKPVFYFPENDKSWSLDKLPVLPEQTVYLPNPKVEAQIHVVNKLLRQYCNDKIIIATDADREGELIARIVLKQSGVSFQKNNLFRFWTSEALTVDVVLEYLDKIRYLSDYNELAAQGYARQEADWIVGMNMTMFSTLNNNNKLFPVGRVQTALVAAIAKRNDEIKNFVPKPYLTLNAELKDAAGSSVTAHLINPETKEFAFPPDSDFIRNAKSYLELKPKIEINVKISQKKSSPLKLLSLTELYKIASDKFNLTSAETLTIAQKLYEVYKCISYPRTPSDVMGDDNVDLFLQKFNELKNLSPFSKYSNIENITASNKHIFNSAKLEAHHALIPLSPLPNNASDKEKGIYSLILNRFFISCMDDYIYDEIKYLVKADKYFLSAREEYPVSPGWMQITPDKCKFRNRLDISSSRIERIFSEKKMTEPKKQFTESTLLTFMKNPRMEERAHLAGLGTEATRASMIAKIQDYSYVEKRNKSFYVTDKGLHLLKFLSQDSQTIKLIDIGQTTDWEQKLSDNPHSFISDMKEYISACMKINITTKAYEGTSAGSCPLCNDNVVEQKYSYSCSNENCSFKINKIICSSKINVYEMKLILQGKKTRLKSFKKKNGEKFKSKIALSPDKTKIIFVN